MTLYAIDNPGLDPIGPFKSATATGGVKYVCVNPDDSTAVVWFSTLKNGHSVVDASTVTFPAPIPTQEDLERVELQALEEYKNSIRREAEELKEKGDTVGAFLKLISIGDLR